VTDGHEVKSLWNLEIRRNVRAGGLQQWIQLEEPLPDPNKPIASLSDQRPPLAWQITPLN
jgi:hypothetical protein